jgi:hypothetical protein
MLRSINHNIVVRVARTDNSLDTYVLQFNGDGEILRILKNDTEQDISKTVPRIDSFTVYMHNETMLNVFRVTISYFTEVIAIEDTDKPQKGVEYLGPPLSYTKPITLWSRAAADTTQWQATQIQYLTFTTTAPEAETQYHYRVIARDEYGNISDPSNISHASIDQELSAVRNMLFGCDWQPGVAPDDQAWVTTQLPLIVNDPGYIAPWRGRECLDTQAIFHHQYVKADIRTNYINDVTQTSVGIFLPNQWFQKDKYYKAQTKAFRVTSTSGLIEGYVTHSNVVMPRDLMIPTERLIILRHEVDTVDDLDFDLRFFENLGQKVAEWVRLFGRYYDQTVSDDSKLNVDVFRDPSLIYPVEDSQFTANSLSVFDDTVEHGKIYRYDIYTWDEYNTESKVLPIYVTCL